MAEWLASPDWDREAEKSWVRIPVSLSGILSRGNLRVIVSRSSTPVTVERNVVFSSRSLLMAVNDRNRLAYSALYCVRS